MASTIRRLAALVVTHHSVDKEELEREVDRALHGHRDEKAVAVTVLSSSSVPNKA